MKNFRSDLLDQETGYLNEISHNIIIIQESMKTIPPGIAIWMNSKIK